MDGLSICLEDRGRSGGARQDGSRFGSDQVGSDFVVGVVLNEGKIVTSYDDFLPRPLTLLFSPPFHTRPLCRIGNTC